MQTLKQYLSDPKHGMVDLLCREAGLPEDPFEIIKCTDCGEEVMAVECHVLIDRETFESTGPHCGCIKMGGKNG